LGIGSLAIVFLSVPAWYPTYLIRVYDLSAATVGFQFGVVLLIASSAALLLAPIFTKALEARGFDDAPLRVAAISTVGMFVSALAIPFAQGPTGAMAIGGSLIFFYNVPSPLMSFSTLSVTPGPIRGVASSVFTLTAQVVGYGIGPTLVALCTDEMFADPKMVGNSLQIVCSITAVMTGYLLYSNLPHYRKLKAAVPDSMEVPGA
jgi:MFS transporter, Spinster family, sphingosine-1-phosphate transporter